MKDNNFRLNKKQFNKWIEALRSGKYKQTTLRLQDGVNNFCCLGVACKILISDEKLVKHGHFIAGGTPRNQNYAPQWLKDISTNFRAKQYDLSKNKDYVNVSIVSMNDKLKLNFNEIADMLELVYIHKAWD